MRNNEPNAWDLINELIPSSVEDAEYLRNILCKLINTYQEDFSDLSVFFKLPNHSDLTLSADRLKSIFLDVRRKRNIEQFPVAAYLGSLGNMLGSKREQIAYEWAANNAYTLIVLASITQHDEKVKRLCAIFRLAQTPAKRQHQWLWDWLPSSRINLSDISTFFSDNESYLQDTINNQRDTDAIFIPDSADNRINELRRIYQTADDLRKKTHRRRSSGFTRQQGKSTESTPDPEGTRFEWRVDDDDISPLNEISFDSEEPTVGVDSLENRFDTKTSRLIDDNFRPPVQAMYSTRTQAESLKYNIIHTTRSQFAFPTSTATLPLNIIQSIFKILWDGMRDGSAIDAAMILTLVTGKPIETWSDIAHLQQDKDLSVNWIQKTAQLKNTLYIAKQPYKELEPYQINTSRTISIPLPTEPLETIVNQEHSASSDFLIKQNVNARISELKSCLKLPALSIGRIISSLHVTILRHTPGGNRLRADILTGVNPRHYPAIYYASETDDCLMNIYTDAVKKITAEVDEFPHQRLYYPTERISVGSQQTLNPELVSKIFENHGTYVEKEPDALEQFNAYNFWLWDIFLLLTGIRPVNGAPGLLNQIDIEKGLMWISDKESRAGVSGGRFVPLCNFLTNSVKDFIQYLTTFRTRYGALHPEILTVLDQIEDSKRPLLNFYNDEGWYGLTPGITRSKTFRDKFLPPSNWHRHFVRYFLTDRLPEHLINAIMGHELPGMEALNPYSSISIVDIKESAHVFDELAFTLGIRRITVHV